jgi:hypothetical protein
MRLRKKKGKEPYFEKVHRWPPIGMGLREASVEVLGRGICFENRHDVYDRIKLRKRKERGRYFQKVGIWPPIRRDW